MPKLLLFAPCQKVILDQNDSSFSLISIMHSLALGSVDDTSPEQKIQPDSQIPLPWGIGTIWLRLADDGEKTFEQRIEIVRPDNRRAELAVQSFKMTHRTYQIATLANAFPVGIAGEYIFILSLREVGVDNEWQELAEYPIELKYSEITSKSTL